MFEAANLFGGSVIAAVDSQGRLALPRFIAAIAAGGPLLLAPHECDPCLAGFVPAFAPFLFADAERRRLRDEAAGLGPRAHFVRARRAFGLAEEIRPDSAGRVLLPARLRARAGIGALALILGAGPTFEIWDPARARDAGEPDLRELAAWRLGHPQTNEREART